jgi:dephospho-CoA kinase
VLRVGLTGGIGAGKSTVGAGLVERGAALIDGDRIAREILEPDGPAFAPVISRFGPDVIGPEGRLDRAALAAVVFGDPAALGDLNAITHPLIASIMTARLGAWEGTDQVVVLDIPLLTADSVAGYGIEVVVVVDVPEAVAVERLVAYRGFDESDARARIAAQIPRRQRLAFADLVIDNSGPLKNVVAEVDRVWAVLSELRAERTSG